MKDGMKTDIKIGLSGSKILLTDKGTIKKYLPVNNPKRSKFQIMKQQSFNNNIFLGISVPKILDIQKNYFEMENILGESYSEYFDKCSKSDLDNFINIIKNYFKVIRTDSINYNPDLLNKLLIEKIDNLYKFSKHKNFLNFLKKEVESNTFSNIPKSYCHGDLSITNIIFVENKLYFIDFIDSFVDTFLIDLVKLKQDLFYKWALKIHSDNLRYNQSFDYIWKNIYGEYKNYFDNDFCNILDCINLLRIEPYLKKEKQNLILKNILIKTKYYEKFNRSYSR